MAEHLPETHHAIKPTRGSKELGSTDTEDGKLTKPRTKVVKVRKSGPITEAPKTRTRSCSLSRRKSRRQALIYAYQQQTRTRLNVDCLPRTEEDGENCERVLRADSASPGVRRGRGYFRGIGESFSTCRNRRRGRAKGVPLEMLTQKEGLSGRALSPSPERV